MEYTELKQLAEQGDASAQCKLGVMYTLGDGVEQDFKKAAYWWKQSAEQGYAEAHFFLGLHELKQGKNQVVGFLAHACKTGDADAQFYFGLMFKWGQGVSQDYMQAAYWFKQSAEQGHTKAQNLLGNMYYKGQGVEKDEQQAIYWWKKSARITTQKDK